MLKNLAGLECKVEERIIKLICDNDCPLSHLKEALFQFQKYIGQVEDHVKMQQQKELDEKNKSEEDSKKE